MAQPSQPDLIPGVLGHTRERVSVSECGIFRFVHAGSAAARSHAAARTTWLQTCSLQPAAAAAATHPHGDPCLINRR
jgi:hypothetical protein